MKSTRVSRDAQRDRRPRPGSVRQIRWPEGSPSHELLVGRYGERGCDRSLATVARVIGRVLLLVGAPRRSQPDTSVKTKQPRTHLGGDHSHRRGRQWLCRCFATRMCGSIKRGLMNSEPPSGTSTRLTLLGSSRVTLVSRRGRVVRNLVDQLGGPTGEAMPVSVVTLDENLRSGSDSWKSRTRGVSVAACGRRSR